jgi:hypothetical protein
MYANPNADDEAHQAGEFLQISALTGAGPLTLSAAEAGARPQGTVEATIAAADRHFYGQGSEALIRGTPLAITPKRRTRVSAKDLVDELQSINTQIHRIMFQVEKAVARLATSG